MREFSRSRISHSTVRVVTAYSRRDVCDEVAWLLAEDGTDETLVRVWQLVRPNAVVLLDPTLGEDKYLLQQDAIDPVERPKRHEHGH